MCNLVLLAKLLLITFLQGWFKYIISNMLVILLGKLLIYVTIMRNVANMQQSENPKFSGKY